MQVKLNAYVRSRMKQRRIRVSEIKAVLGDPEVDRPSKDAPGRRVYEGHPNGRHVAVVVIGGHKARYCGYCIVER